MDDLETTTNLPVQTAPKFTKTKIVGIAASIFGAGLFLYFLYSVGPSMILQGVSNMGVFGFGVILTVYFFKLLTRAYGWTLTVYEPYELKLSDTIPAVFIGEALSSVLPLGILISGTAKAIAVRKKIPIVPGLASVATENLFYTLITAIFVFSGVMIFVRSFAVPAPFDSLVDGLLISIVLAVILGILMVLRQWHIASGFCEWFYAIGIFKKTMGNLRLHVRMFENLIYGFYRKHPKRMLPLCGLQVVFHALGVFEVWFILTRITEAGSAGMVAFFLESMSRLVTFVFKLVPFLVGVDEASAEFVIESLGIAAGVGVTLAIVRKGRVLFWALIGFALILKRGLSISEVNRIREAFRQK